MSKSPAVIKITTGMRGPKGDAFVASLGTLALSAASPTVPALANVNEWTVTGAVQVQLPTVANGSQFTVLVKSGFQGLTWPNGTQVLGATEQTTNVVVTLARLATGWTVFVPTGGGGSGMIDTGWTTVLNVANLGSGLQFTAGDASMIGTGWTVTTATMLASVQIRRSGNFLLVRINGGFTAAAGATSTVLTLPKPAGLVGESPMHYLNTATVAGAKTPALYSCAVEAAANGKLKIETTGALTAGVVVASQGPLMFPIAPASTWGD